MTKRLSTIALLLIALSSQLPMIGSVQAQSTGLHLITSPLPINLVVSPGKSITTELKVQNAGSSTEQLQVNLLKFSAYGDSGSPKLEDRQVGDDYFDWVTFSPQTFSIVPNEWKTVIMTITVPKTAAFGYYYAVTFSRSKPSAIQPVGKPETSLVGATAALVLLEVRSPNARRNIQVETFATDHPWYEFLPVSFTVKLRNLGNVHAVPSGNIFVDQGSQHDIGILDVNSGKGNILPNSSRVFTTQWTDGFPLYTPKTENGKILHLASGEPETSLRWQFNQADKLRFGHYTAHLLLAYDDGKRDVPIEATVGFWVIPWRLLLGGVVIGVFVLLGLWSTGKGLYLRILHRGSREGD